VRANRADAGANRPAPITRTLLVLGAVLLATGAGAQDADIADLPPLEGPAAAVSAEIDVERALLVDDLTRFDLLTRQRDAATTRLADLHR
jgi:hypothetical protein